MILPSLYDGRTLHHGHSILFFWIIITSHHSQNNTYIHCYFPFEEAASAPYQEGNQNMRLDSSSGSPPTLLWRSSFSSATATRPNTHHYSNYYCSRTTTTQLVGVFLILWMMLWWWEDVEFLLHHPQEAKEEEKHPHITKFDHFLVHTPKSGGSYAFDGLRQLLQQTTEYQSLPVKARRTICDGRTRPTTQFETRYPYDDKAASSKFSLRRGANSAVICDFWMAEQPYTALAKHNYIVMRHPRAHILSQYFHCKESINHYDRWKYMPSLTAWLEAWVAAIHNETQVQLNQHFHCFDARNMQAQFAGWRSTSSSITQDDQNTTVAAFEQYLSSHFDVVGDNARMWPSICAILIRYTGGWIPPDCDCTATTPPPQDRNRQLKIHLYGHGVRHHGSSYVTTARQDDLLAQLMDQDLPLYQAAQQVFENQRRSIEAQYGIQICSHKP